MPACEYGHKHPPWPKAGPMVICPGERECGYCDWKTSDRASAPANTKMDNGAAQSLRKHVCHEHTDGGKEDRSAVEVMLYRPGLKNTKGEHMERFAYDTVDVENESDGSSIYETGLGKEYDEACDDAEQKPLLTSRFKIAAKGRLHEIDTPKAQ